MTTVGPLINNPVTVAEKLVDDDEYEKEQNAANVGYILDEEMKNFTQVPELSGKRLKYSRLQDSNVSEGYSMFLYRVQVPCT